MDNINLTKIRGKGGVLLRGLVYLAFIITNIDFFPPTDQDIDPIRKTLCHSQLNLRRNYISNKVLFLKMERGIPGVGLWMWRKRKYAIATLILKLHSINHVSQLIFEVINYNQKKIFQYNLKNWSGFTHVRFFFFFFLE